MDNAAAISAVNRALANYRRRQANAPTDYSAREIVQMSMLAEYLHEHQTPDLYRLTGPHSIAASSSATSARAA